MSTPTNGDGMIMMWIVDGEIFGGRLGSLDLRFAPKHENLPLGS